MNKDEKIKAHKALTDKLISKETEIAEEITKTIIDFYEKQSTDWQSLYEDIIDLMYISLKQTYKITIQEGQKIYDLENTDITGITKKDIAPYLYDKDNLTLEERVKQYITEAKEKDDYDKISRDALVFKEIRILDNETLVVSHKLLKKKIKAEYGMVVGGGGCRRDCCSAQTNEWQPIDEIEEPPYHPNCTCEIIYGDPEEDDETE